MTRLNSRNEPEKNNRKISSHWGSPCASGKVLINNECIDTNEIPTTSTTVTTTKSASTSVLIWPSCDNIREDEIDGECIDVKDYFDECVGLCMPERVEECWNECTTYDCNSEPDYKSFLECKEIEKLCANGCTNRCTNESDYESVMECGKIETFYQECANECVYDYLNVGLVLLPPCDTMRENQIDRKCIDTYESVDESAYECVSECMNDHVNECSNEYVNISIYVECLDFDELSNQCVNKCLNKCETGQHNCQSNEECINMERGFQCRPIPSTTTLNTNTTATTGTTATTTKIGQLGDSRTDGQTVFTSNSPTNQVGILVGAIVASIILTSMIFLIIYFFKRRNRSEKNTQTTFQSNGKLSPAKQSRISRLSQPIYDDPYEHETYEEYGAYLSPMRSTYKNRTFSF